jgi:DNA-binding CsgD family transcriptional regulator
MPRLSSRKTTAAAMRPGDSREEIGRIMLGGRVYEVVQLSNLGKYVGKQESCRFELGSHSLVVFTADDACDEARLWRDDIAGKLTGRELEIAVLVARGLATKNIAHKLQISEWTVATYMRRIFAKLGVYSRAAMVYRCASLIDITNDYYNGVR